MIPFFIYYSMFGFQRIGDLIWAAGDMRAKGFLIGGTAGRTTLNGEGLQHQDGHSLLNAIAFPHVRAYDPAYRLRNGGDRAGRPAAAVPAGRDGDLLHHGRNENYEMPAMPAGVEEGIIRGMYKLPTREAAAPEHRVQLFGSGAILRSALRAQEILAEKYGVGQQRVERDQLHAAGPRGPGLRAVEHAAPDRRRGESLSAAGAGGRTGRVRRRLWTTCGPWPNRSGPGSPATTTRLGCDGMGRSDTREALRRHFEVDAESRS